MPAKYRQDGDAINDWTNGTGSTRSQGDAIELDATDNIVGIVGDQSVANGATGALAMTGVFELVKGTATDTWSAGAALDITIVSSEAQVAAGAGGTHIAWSDTANGDTTTTVKINAR